ncbi:MAG: hypothetical protein KBS81_10975 [Spirochaetales bacterium]|nr:hypothetical protein [Candidatus Physcosoma equi]
MATRKTEKDKKIEALEAANDALRRRSAFSSWLESLSKRKRILYMVLLLALVLFLVLSFTYVALEATRPVKMTRSLYDLFLSEVDQRRWRISKDSWEAFRRHVHGGPSGTVFTRRNGESLYLIADGEMECIYQFIFRDGQIMGMFSSYPSVLQYSESSLKSGRALTLQVGKDKLVFYED